MILCIARMIFATGKELGTGKKIRKSMQESSQETSPRDDQSASELRIKQRPVFANGEEDHQYVEI